MHEMDEAVNWPFRPSVPTSPNVPVAGPLSGVGDGAWVGAAEAAAELAEGAVLAAGLGTVGGPVMTALPPQATTSRVAANAVAIRRLGAGTSDKIRRRFGDCHQGAQMPGLRRVRWPGIQA